MSALVITTMVIVLNYLKKCHKFGQVKCGVVYCKVREADLVSLTANFKYVYSVKEIKIIRYLDNE